MVLAEDHVLARKPVLFTGAAATLTLKLDVVLVAPVPASKQPTHTKYVPADAYVWEPEVDVADPSPNVQAAVKAPLPPLQTPPANCTAEPATGVVVTKLGLLTAKAVVEPSGLPDGVMVGELLDPPPPQAERHKVAAKLRPIS